VSLFLGVACAHIKSEEAQQTMDPVSEIVPSSAIRVFLIMENRLLREALIRLLRKRSDLVVVSYEGAPNPTACEVLNTQFDVLLIDSFQTMRSAAKNGRGNGRQPDHKVLLIGMEPDEKLFMAAIRSGVMGYLLKDASASDLVCAVRSVCQGDAVCPSQLCSALFRFVARSIEEIPAKPRVPRPDLTLRQQQLMALVAKGLTNKEIALSLHLSEFTVRNHIHRILKQLDTGSRSAAVEAIRCQSQAISP
jgi:DNA-binding NarL/FixJ family response regulator